MNFQAIDQMLSEYAPVLDALIRASVEDFGLEEGGLRAPIEYALLSGGKRIRPLIVFMTAKGLKKGFDVSDAAVAIEFVHTSTLIADDLPCMDDDAERRNRPTVHIAFNESKALLASFALISAAYERIRQNFHKLREVAGKDFADVAYDKVLENVTHNTGFFGVIGGQYEDMYALKSSEERVKSILHKKTGALFELSFVMGWLFGGGDLEGLQEIKALAYQFGIMFQLGDDLLDYEQDLAKEDVGLNFALLFGKDRARQELERSIQASKELLNLLEDRYDFDKGEFLTLIEFLSSRGY